MRKEEGEPGKQWLKAVGEMVEKEVGESVEKDVRKILEKESRGNGGEDVGEKVGGNVADEWLMVKDE